MAHDMEDRTGGESHPIPPESFGDEGGMIPVCEEDPNTVADRLARISIGPLPTAWDVERALLGCLLLRPEEIEEAAGDMTAEHFTDKAHRMLWQVLVTLQQRQAPIDAITVAETAARMGVADTIGGLPGVMEIIGDTWDFVHWDAYAGILKEKARLRQVVHTLEKAARAVQSGRAAANQIVAEALTGLETAIGRNRIPYRKLGDLVEASLAALEETAKQGGGVTGVTSGSTVLDEVTLGFQPGDLIILAARPSMGKTTLALNWARNAAIEGRQSVGIFSLEMGAESLAQKFLSMESGVPLQQLRAARLEINDWYKLAFGVKELQDAAIYIDDTAGLSVAEFRARAREMKRRENIQCVIVDYLQLMEYKGLDNRVQEISGISRTLKQVGRELGIPVIALSQLSRDVEKREDKRPMLSDLRESGSIEQDADMVVFLYRDAYYHRGENTGEDVTEVIVAKHRNGPVGTVTLRFNKTIGRFVDHGELVTA